MKKETMLTYLDKKISKEIIDYDVAIDWNAKNHSIEVIVRLFAENTEQVKIDDVDGTESGEVIEFEDGILFYSPVKSNVDKEDYLAVIPYEGKKGIKQAVLDGFVSYLNNVLAEGQADLLDFLTDVEAEVFELKWSENAFRKVVQQYESKDSDTYIAYPSY